MQKQNGCFIEAYIAGNLENRKKTVSRNWVKLLADILNTHLSLTST